MEVLTLKKKKTEKKIFLNLRREREPGSDSWQMDVDVLIYSSLVNNFFEHIHLLNIFIVHSKHINI